MKIIAVTGGIGSGKSTVAGEFKNLGAVVISADKVSHLIMKKGGLAYNKVTEVFGDGILNADKEINRKTLAGIVFNDKDKLILLNSITHSLIYKVMAEEVKKAEEADKDVVCLEIPLLFNDKCPIDYDMSIAVVADKEVRINRVINRDKCTRSEAESRMTKQLTDDKLKEYADCVVENNGDLLKLKKSVKEIYDRLTD